MKKEDDDVEEGKHQRRKRKEKIESGRKKELKRKIEKKKR